MSLHNPFIDTILYTTVDLTPDQLNNNIYSNLKQNLIKSVERKCFRANGYVSKVYEILERDNGYISAEDRDCNVTYRIKFACQLCHPLENTQIICQVHRCRELFVNLIREPINIIVTADRINRGIFLFDQQVGKLKIIKTGEVVEDGTFVKATIVAKTFVDRDIRIMSLATLDDIASDKEIEEYYGTIHTSDKKFISLDDYKANAVADKEEKKKETEVVVEPKKETKIKESKTAETTLEGMSDSETSDIESSDIDV